MSHGCTLLSSPSPDKIRLQCSQGLWGCSYIIKYTGGAALRFVIQSLDCLNIHSASGIDDKDVTRDAMDESDKRGGGGGGTKADRSTHICNDTQTEKLRQ